MDQLLEWFGADRYHEALDRIERFWRGEGRCLISITTDHGNYRQTFDDAVMLERAPENLRAQAALPGVNMPSFFADFGTVSTAKYWGGTARFDSTGGNIFLDPVAADIDAALALTPRAVDDPEMDGARGVRLYKEVCVRLATRSLWLRSPDMQGVLNTAGMVLDQEELLMALYAEPDKVHAFLARVCEFLIGYANYLRRETGDKVCGNIWPFTFVPSSLGLCLTEDLMPLLSPELYRKFGVPQLQRLQRAFGGLHIHCCGDWGRHAANLAAAGLNILAVEFHYPATRIEELAPLADRTVFIPYLLEDRQQDFTGVYDYWRYLLRETDARFWFLPGEDEDGVRFYEEFEHLMPA